MDKIHSKMNEIITNIIVTDKVELSVIWNLILIM